jgi:hypothetical protein
VSALEIIGMVTVASAVLGAALWFFSRVLGAVNDPDATYVYLRSTETPAMHWEAKVLYDVWGCPYIADDYFKDVPACFEQALFKDGTTSDTPVYGTEWRHKSGPPVRFATKPAKPFAKSKRTEA